MERELAKILAKSSYKTPVFPFKDAVRKWHNDIELDILDNPKQIRREWWHWPTYHAGMIAKGINGGLGDWIVHRVPFEIRFQLA